MPGVYRIPVRSWYNQHRVDKNKSWDDVYGRAICQNCHQHFKEGEAYTMLPDGKHGVHIECPPKEKKQKEVPIGRNDDEFRF